MFVIFGTKSVTYTKSHGEFNCPVCKLPHPYKHKRIRKFVSLYFIPVIPLNLLGEYVECQQCHGTFTMEVLDFIFPLSQEIRGDNLLPVILEVLVCVLKEKGAPDFRVVWTVYHQVTGEGIAEVVFSKELERQKETPRTLEAILNEVAALLGSEEKEKLLRTVMLASGDKELCMKAGEVLAMEPASCVRIFEEV